MNLYDLNSQFRFLILISSVSKLNVYDYIHTFIYPSIHVHPCMHTYIVHIDPQIHENTYACIHILHTHIHPYKHTCIDTRDIHTYILHPHILHARINTHIYIYILLTNSHIHTPTHTSTHRLPPGLTKHLSMCKVDRGAGMSVFFLTMTAAYFGTHWRHVLEAMSVSLRVPPACLIPANSSRETLVEYRTMQTHSNCTRKVYDSFF